MRPPQTHMFCIAHTKIQLNIPKSAYVIRTSRGFLRDDVHPNLISLDDVSEDLDYYYPWLGGTAGILAVPDVFRERKIECAQNDRVMIFQQAKIVTPHPFGWQSKTYPGMRVVPWWLADGVNVESISMSSKEFLLSQLISLPGGDMTLYSHIHHLPDYLRFCAVAIDEGVLTSEQAIDMCKQEVLIPGGGLLGTYPVDWFLKTIEISKKVGLSFLDTCRPGLKSAYQRIALGYLIERLTSYLLLKKFSMEYGGVPNEFIGNLLAVSDSDYMHGASSSKNGS